MEGIIGKKIGMTSIFAEDGRSIPCTMIEAGPCVVTQVKTEEKDGYRAVQIGFGDVREKSANKALTGHFRKANTAVKQKTVEFKGFGDKKEGDVITTEIFKEGEWVDVTGTSKGKGFQGVVKRHGFSGVGMGTHGQHNRLRAPGSVGASSHPSRVFKGIRMAGRMGGKKSTVINLQVVKILPEKNLLVLRGAVPGASGSLIVVHK